MQPHVPADLGYYDLRMPEVVAAKLRGDGCRAEGAPGRRAARAKGSPDRLLAAGEDFSAFHAEMTGEAPGETMARLFDEIAREAADASA